MELPQLLWETALSTLSDVLPIAIIIFGFQLFILRQRIPNLKSVLAGFFYVLVGLTLFLVGLQEALFPLGKLMAQQLTDPEFIRGTTTTLVDGLRWQDYTWVYLFAAAIGFATTIAEPALIAVAIKAHNISGGTISVWGLRVAVAIGVAIGITLGTFRITTGTPLYDYIIAGYLIVMIQTLYAPRSIIALAYDSGGGDDLHRDGADGGGAGTGSGHYRTRAQCTARRLRSHRFRQPVSDNHGHGLCPDRRLVATPGREAPAGTAGRMSRRRCRSCVAHVAARHVGRQEDGTAVVDVYHFVNRE
jgi:hypothetical protein